MMADLDRITELLLSDEEMPDVYYSMLENASDTEPTLDPNSLEALIANRQSQGELLMNMAEITRYTKNILAIVEYYREYDEQGE